MVAEPADGGADSKGVGVVTRADLKPGQIFALRELLLAVWWLWPKEALVVIDDKFEVGFWTGAKYCIGDVASAFEVEVLS
jgi:hypothetical protein